MPNLPLQLATFIADSVVIFLVVYFIGKITKREKQLEERERELAKKEGKIDIDYHQIVDNALTKERKILEDAIAQAKTIIANTQYVSQNSKQIIDRALQEMVIDIKKDSDEIGRQFIDNYKYFLNKVSATSLTDFQNIAKQFGVNLDGQIREFSKTLLPNLEKEIAGYKQERLKGVDKIVEAIVQKVAQKALNKSIPVSDHNNLILEALERAKKEGIFD
jgi:F0F1-type ATP synthase membrane subunit b/b'